MSMKKDLADMSKECGASLFGVASSEDLKGALEGHRPSDILPEAQSLVILGQKMLDAQADLQNTGGDYYTESPREDMIKGHVTFVSRELDRIGYKLARFLERKGYKTYHQMSS